MGGLFASLPARQTLVSSYVPTNLFSPEAVVSTMSPKVEERNEGGGEKERKREREREGERERDGKMFKEKMYVIATRSTPRLKKKPHKRPIKRSTGKHTFDRNGISNISAKKKYCLLYTSPSPRD